MREIILYTVLSALVCSCLGSIEDPQGPDDFDNVPVEHDAGDASLAKEAGIDDTEAGI